MRWTKILSIVIGVVFLVIAVIYGVAPDVLNGAPAEGELAPQYGMSGQAVTYTMITVRLGIIDLSVPQWSTVVVIGIVGVALIAMGVMKDKKGGGK